MSFTNLYYKRAVGTARGCYVCHKPTTTVLATIKTVDFIYVCDGHLKDPGFASQVGDTNDGIGSGGAKTGISQEEIAKVKQEWEERVKKRRDKDKDTEKGKGTDVAEKDSDKDAKKVDSEAQKTKTLGSWTPPAAASGPPAASHERYTLHRDVFALRLTEHRRRRQAAQAKELAPRLPGAPRASLPRPPA